MTLVCLYIRTYIHTYIRKFLLAHTCSKIENSHTYNTTTTYKEKRDNGTRHAFLEQRKQINTGSMSDNMSAEALNENRVLINFTQDWDVGLGGGLWSTGQAMANYFHQHASEINSDLTRLGLSKKTGHEKLLALELGSGNGYLSCSFAHHFGSLCQVCCLHHFFLYKAYIVTPLLKMLSLSFNHCRPSFGAKSF